MKIKYIIGLGLLMGFNAVASVSGSLDVDKIADAIYVIEGGKKTKYPYGVRSINTNGDVVKARKICINTITNTHKRWIAANKPNNFLDYLADRYCPPTADKVGNERWKKNIRKFVNKV